MGLFKFLRGQVGTKHFTKHWLTPNLNDLLGPGDLSGPE